MTHVMNSQTMSGLSWFEELPNLIKYYTTIGNRTLLKDEYTKIGNFTLLKDLDYFVYITKLDFQEETPNQIMHMLSTLLLWSKIFYSTIGQYPTLYDFLAIAPEDICCWEYYLAYPNKCSKPNTFQPTVLLHSTIE